MNLNNKKYNSTPFLGSQEAPQNIEGGKPWNYMSIDQVDGNGNPLTITYWLSSVNPNRVNPGDPYLLEPKLQLTKVITYDANGNPQTVTLY